MLDCMVVGWLLASSAGCGPKMAAAAALDKLKMAWLAGDAGWFRLHRVVSIPIVFTITPKTVALVWNGCGVSPTWLR